MTVPVLLALAVLVICAGYAAGRLHQWYRTDLDRDEAYREGYDTATRSTLSLAARLIGPRRDKAGIRASAAVHTGRPAVPRGTTTAPATPEAATPGGPAAPATMPAAAAAGASAPPAALGPMPVPVPGTPPPHAPSVLLPRPAALPATRPAPADAEPRPAASVPSPTPAASGATRPAPAADAEPQPAASVPSPPPAAPATRPAPADAEPQFGPFFAPSVSSRGPDPAVPAPADGPGRQRGDAPEASRPGRHLVPDELVRAATYRLAPDRVARAKVQGAGRPGDDDIPGARPAVPRPRSS